MVVCPEATTEGTKAGPEGRAAGAKVEAEVVMGTCRCTRRCPLGWCAGGVGTSCTSPSRARPHSDRLGILRTHGSNTHDPSPESSRAPPHCIGVAHHHAQALRARVRHPTITCALAGAASWRACKRANGAAVTQEAHTSRWKRAQRQKAVGAGRSQRPSGCGRLVGTHAVQNVASRWLKVPGLSRRVVAQGGRDERADVVSDGDRECV